MATHSDCKDWLRDLLADDPVKANVIMRQGERAGFTVNQMLKARIAIGAVRRKHVRPGDTLGHGKWLWELLPKDERLMVTLREIERIRIQLEKLTAHIQSALDA